jgi:tetratricopeptide (TPR) repeat protein
MNINTLFDKYISAPLLWANERWAPLALIVFIFLFTLAVYHYDVSPDLAIKEIQVKQEEYQRKLKQKADKEAHIKRHLMLGKSFLNNSRYRAAEKVFKKVLDIEKTNLEAQMGLYKTELIAAMRKGEYIPEVIEKQIELILKENKNDAHALSLLGNLYAQLDLPDEAKVKYNKAIKSNPEIGSAYFGLGIIYEKENNFPVALQYYKKAVSISKWNERYLTNLAHAYARKGKYQKAIEKYEFVLTLDYEYLLPYLKVSHVYRLSGKLREAAWYLYELDRLFDKEKKITDEKGDVKKIKLIDFDKNNGVWFFETDTEPVLLFTIEEKKCYALLSLSMTNFFLERESEAERFLQKANSSVCREKIFIKGLILSDLKVFESKQPAYKDKIEEYRVKIMQAPLKQKLQE